MTAAARRSVLPRSGRELVVLGGAGTIGRTVVRDLVESHRSNRVLVADFDEAAARSVARGAGSRRVRAAFAEASDVAALVELFRGAAAVINCTQHHHNLEVMEAALAAGLHYVDLGGLFTFTRKQLRLHRRFRDAGLTAVLGAGCAPGLTNVLVCHAAERLARVEEVRIWVGGRDFAGDLSGFMFPYSPATVVEEMTLPPWVFERGRFRQIPPRRRWELVDFPAPVGAVWTVCTRHSEIATLPLTLKAKGLRRCEFKVGFEREFVRELVRRLRSGWTVRDFARLIAPRTRPDDYEISRVRVTGRAAAPAAPLPTLPLRERARVEGTRAGPTGTAARPGRLVSRCVILELHARSNPDWNASAGDIDTGCPPSIVAQMILDGTISSRGVLAPEVAIPAGPFFLELERRGMRLVELPGE